LRAVLDANGLKLEDLSEQERAQVLDALNAMSRHPQKVAANEPSPSPTVSSNKTPDKTQNAATARVAKKPIAKNQKEVVIELTALKGKGYPAAVNLDTGSGKPATPPAVATKSGL
jgi:hypothetical protein